MVTKAPYFFKNKKMYYNDKKEGKYKLTKEALKKAIESYKEFYKKLEGNYHF